MANRMTTYGYGYIDGKLSVIESEAEIVRRVFKEYCNGAILTEIGQSLTREGVEYYMGCTQWNKNRIKRIPPKWKRQGILCIADNADE